MYAPRKIPYQCSGLFCPGPGPDVYDLIPGGNIVLHCIALVHTVGRHMRNVRAFSYICEVILALVRV